MLVERAIDWKDHAAVLDLLAAEGRLTAQPEPEPAGVRPWDVKDGCW